MLYHLYTLDKNSENRHIRSLLSHVKMNGAGSMGAKRLLLLLT